MPGPRQQDRRLEKDELVTYRYSIVLIEVQREWRGFAISPTFLLVFVTIESMWYFQERF